MKFIKLKRGIVPFLFVFYKFIICQKMHMRKLTNIKDRKLKIEIFSYFVSMEKFFNRKNFYKWLYLKYVCNK